MYGLKGWAHWGHPSKRDSWQRAGTLPTQDTPPIVNSRSYEDPWFCGNMLDSDRSELSSNLTQVIPYLLTLLLFAINKAYFY